MTKHFPGGGPQKDGEDPHFAYGREQVYPGGRFELHLKPFEAAFEAGTRQIMPYYGMPVGTEHEEVGFGFNRSVITGLLRERFGFDGVVCTDWGLLDRLGRSSATPIRRARGASSTCRRRSGRRRSWMPEPTSSAVRRAPSCVLELLAEGGLTMDRLDVSVRRLLREKFALGLFDDPFVDEDEADRIVGRADFRAEGEAAQRASVTLLADTGILPLATGTRLYVEGIDAQTAAAYGTVVDDPADADVAILRLHAPFETRATAFENFFHAGSLDFPVEVIAHVREVAAAVPTVVDVLLDRPAILEPLADVAAALTANWGVSAAALLDVLTGAAVAKGRLPFDVPRSMAAVEASRPDVPFDTADPLFRFGHGLDLPTR